MNLFMARLNGDFYVGHFNELFQAHFQVEVRVKKVENGPNIFLCSIVLGLDSSEKTDQLLNSSKSIFILVIGRFKENLEVF